MKNQLTATLASLAFLSLSTSAWSLDDPNKPKLGELDPFAEQDPQEEMRRLFKEVELRLDRMQGLLLDASAGETDSLREVTESGIDELFRDAEDSNSPAAGSGGVAKLLKNSRSHGDQVVQDIDRILEIAAQNGGT